MAFNYRYNKKGDVTGVGWGKGKNYEAGAKNQKKNLEKQQAEVRRLDKEAAARKAAKKNKTSGTTKSNVFTKHYKTGKDLGVMTRSERRRYDKEAAGRTYKPKNKSKSKSSSTSKSTKGPNWVDKTQAKMPWLKKYKNPDGTNKTTKKSKLEVNKERAKKFNKNSRRKNPFLD